MKIEIEGDEYIIKTATKHGNGAMVYVPKAWIGQRIGLVRNPK